MKRQVTQENISGASTYYKETLKVQISLSQESVTVILSM